MRTKVSNALHILLIGTSSLPGSCVCIAMLNDVLLIRYMFILLILDTVSCSMGAVLLSGDIKSTWLYSSTSQQQIPLINSPDHYDESKISAKNVECLIFATCMFMGISLPIYTSLCMRPICIFIGCATNTVPTNACCCVYSHPGIVLLLMMFSLYDTSVFNCWFSPSLLYHDRLLLPCILIIIQRLIYMIVHMHVCAYVCL